MLLRLLQCVCVCVQRWRQQQRQQQHPHGQQKRQNQKPTPNNYNSHVICVLYIRFCNALRINSRICINILMVTTWNKFLSSNFVSYLCKNREPSIRMLLLLLLLLVFLLPFSYSFYLFIISTHSFISFYSRVLLSVISTEQKQPLKFETMKKKYRENEKKNKKLKQPTT